MKNMRNVSLPILNTFFNVTKRIFSRENVVYKGAVHKRRHQSRGEGGGLSKDDLT